MRVLPRLEREAALCCREELNEELKAEVQRFEASHRNAALPPVRAGVRDALARTLNPSATGARAARAHHR
jgi:hypothetical protein